MTVVVAATCLASTGCLGTDRDLETAGDLSEDTAAELDGDTGVVQQMAWTTPSRIYERYLATPRGATEQWAFSRPCDIDAQGNGVNCGAWATPYRYTTPQRSTTSSPVKLGSDTLIMNTFFPEESPLVDFRICDIAYSANNNVGITTYAPCAAGSSSPMDLDYLPVDDVSSISTSFLYSGDVTIAHWVFLANDGRSWGTYCKANVDDLSLDLEVCGAFAEFDANTLGLGSLRAAHTFLFRAPGGQLKALRRYLANNGRVAYQSTCNASVTFTHPAGQVRAQDLHPGIVQHSACTPWRARSYDGERAAMNQLVPGSVSSFRYLDSYPYRPGN